MELLIGVISSNATVARREAVMATWGRDYLDSNAGDLLVYVSSAQKHRVRDGNVLHVDTTDDYSHNTWRFVEYLRFVVDEYDPDMTFNCCDDTYVAVDRLLAFDREGHDYIGQPCRGQDNKYHVYASGGAGFFLSRDAMRVLLGDDGFLTHCGLMPSITDMLIGKHLHQHGIELYESSQFYGQADRWPATDNELITCHYQSPQKMRETHAKYK